MNKNPSVFLKCSCGGSADISCDLLVSERDKLAIQFYEAHSHCREGAMTQARAIESIANTLHDIYALIEERADANGRDEPHD